MWRRVGIVAGIVVGVFVLLVGVGAVVLFTMDWNNVRNVLAEQASGATGRKVEIRGDLNVDVSWRPRVAADDLVITNAPGMQPENMVHAGRVYIEFRVLPLLVGRLEIDALRLADVEINLQKDGDKANWQFGTSSPEGVAVKAVTPSDRGSFPVLRELTVEDAKLTYRDSDIREPIVATFSSLEARGGTLDDPVEVRGAGTYQKAPVAIEARVGSFGTLRSSEAPYPVKVSVRSDATSVSFDGGIGEPVDFKGVDGAVVVAGNNFADLNRLLGLPLPQSPKYRIEGRLRQDGETWHLDGFTGRLGSSDLAGDLAVTTGGARPKVAAKVTSKAVDIADIEGFWGGKAAQPKAQEGKVPAKPATSGGHIIPDEPFDLSKLDRMDAELDFRGQSIKSSDLVLDKINVKLAMSEGRVSLKPLEVGVIGGSVKADVALDATGREPTLEGTLRLSGLQLNTFLKSLDVNDNSVGAVGGNASFATRGRSLYQLAANADGKGMLTMRGGRMSNLLLELMALDLQEAIEQWLSDEKKAVEIGCLLAPLQIRQGKIHADPWVFDTADALVLIRGDIDLRNETIGLKLEPHPKDYSFFNALTSITVEGDLGAQKASVNELEAIAKLAYKTILAPIMPLLSEDIQRDAQAQNPCADLIARANQQQQR